MPPSSSTTVENPPLWQRSSSDDKAFHIDETRSVFPNLSCRETVDRSRCVCKSRFGCHLSSESEQFLLKLRDNLLHRHRYRSASEKSNAMSPPAFRHAQAGQATKVQQPRSARERETTAEVSRPAVHHHAKRIEQRSPKLWAPQRHQSHHHDENNMTMCHMPWIVFLSHSCAACVSV